MLFYLNVKCQVLGKDTLIENRTKKIPTYEIDADVGQLLKNLVDNCNLDTTLNKHPYGYLFYSKEKNDSFFITIKPIETSWFSNIDFYGVFNLYGRKFYCIGDKPGLLFRNNVIPDSIELKYRSEISQSDSIVFYLGMDRFSDLNTIEVLRSINLNNQPYFFFIQPCTNVSKRVLKHWK